MSWVEINHLVMSPDTIRATAGSVEVSAEQISEMNRMVDVVAEFRDVRKLGWWHSHPGWGIFFSPTDRSNQQQIYTGDYQIGVVVDPIRNQYGAFRGPDSQQLDLGVNLFSVPVSREISGSTIHEHKVAVLKQSSGFQVTGRR